MDGSWIIIIKVIGQLLSGTKRLGGAAVGLAVVACLRVSFKFRLLHLFGVVGQFHSILYLGSPLFLLISTLLSSSFSYNLAFQYIVLSWFLFF